MSELINTNDNRATIRWKLLTGASVLALTVSSTMTARAEDASRPPIWIELGGQLSRLEDNQELFAPSIFAGRPAMFAPSKSFEKLPRLGFDEEGRISFQPEDSDWVLSASIRYGRSSAKRHAHQQTYPQPFVLHYLTGAVLGTWPPYAAKFADTNSQISERHGIVDFEVGKDVGLGMFGKGGTSVLSGGVRFAQFNSKANIALKSDPDWHNIYTYLPFLAYYFTQTKFPIQQPYHTNLASMHAERSFRGIGPSVSWKASMPLAGNAQEGAIELDWGLNAALLFGRQKAKTTHQTTARYGSGYFQLHQSTLYKHGPYPHTRSRNVTVPNVGGFAGLSFRYVDAKISLGYKADFFFGAIDSGIDTAKKENRGFNGPYASVSIGIGD